MATITLDAAILAFHAYSVGVKNLSPHTVNDYSRTLNRLAEFLGSQTSIDQITTGDIERFLSHWQGTMIMPGGIVERSPRKLSPKTIRNMQIGISSFMTWAVQKGYIDEHPTQGKISFVKPQQRQIIPYTNDEIDGLLEACESRSYVLPQGTKVVQRRPTRLRDKALIYWLLSTGTRASETVNLSGSDVNLTDRSAIIRWGHAKNRKERQVFFGYATAEALIDYLVNREMLGRSRRKKAVSLTLPDEPVWSTMQGRQMTRDNLLHLIYLLAKKSGVHNANVHRFRHTFAKHAIMNGCGEEALRRMLGHSTLEMVRVYVVLFGQDVQAIHRMVDPVDNLFKRR